MTRLAIQKDVVRDLSIRSKNKCAFPGCDQPILNSSGAYVAELCHIKGAEPGSPRYDPAQSDEDRRSYGNLLFLCHSHHKETDDTAKYPVDRLKSMKAEHEALPEVVFNHQLLVTKVEEVAADMAALREFVEESKAGQNIADNGFTLIGPGLRDAWTPEDGRFYEFEVGGGLHSKLMMKAGWLHVELTLQDGAIFYFEVNRKGSVRYSQMPYPINEYHVEIPDTIVLSRDQVPPKLGTRAIRTTLKWSLGTVTEYFHGSVFMGADCDARCTIEHKTRTIRILVPPRLRNYSE